MSFSIDIIPALTDNYVYLVSDSDLGLALAVDPGDADAVERALKKSDIQLSLILNTHHHKDHTAGNDRLARHFGAAVIGPAKERSLIEGLSRGVERGDTITFSTLHAQVIETHGHTIGHVAYYFPQLKALFSGDALFSLGCGRLFEGTPADMWASLLALRALPDDTLLYGGHEYTEANAKFALALDKANPALQARVAEAAALRKAGKPTLPVPLGVEKKTNPFLRVDDPAFQRALAKAGMAVEGTDITAIFGALRAAKDRFNG